MTLAKRPTEFYGQFVAEGAQARVRRAIEKQECPFLGARCVKIRKSDPSRTIGACSVGYGGKALIVCPKRFLQDQQVFLDAVRLLRPGLNYCVVPEITVPGGNIDYFLVGRQGNRVADYAAIEVQGLDTTGSGGIWDAREDIRKNSLRESYGYGINWKMSAKTVLVQMHHKALTFEALGKKLVLALQSEFFSYIRREFRSDGLRSARKRDAVHFHAYSTALMNGAVRIVLDERASTDVRGVESMLNLGRGHEMLEEELLRGIEAKLPYAIPLRPEGAGGDHGLGGGK